jgi:hypothetical protein
MKMQLGVGVALLVLGAAACEGEPAGSPVTTEQAEPLFLKVNKQAETELHLITRVKLTANHVVEFYEPTPGQIVISEAAEVPEAPAAELANLEGLMPSQAYAMLAKGAAPSELLQAERRMIDRAQSGALSTAQGELTSDLASSRSTTDATTQARPTEAGAQTPVQRTVGETTTVRSALSGGSCPSEWFATQSFPQGGGTRKFCPGKQFVGDYLWCMLDWWDGAWVKSGNADQSYGTVCADIGNLTLKITSSDHGGGTWTVPQGSYRWWYSGVTTCGPLSYWCDFSIRYDITNAIGSRFNFGGKFAHRD